MSHSKKIPKGIHPIILFLLLQLPNTVSSNLLIHEGHCQLLRHRRALIKPPTLHSKGHGGRVARFSSFLLLFHLLCHLFLLLIPSYTLEVPFKRHGVQGHLILLEKERYLWNVKHFSICQNDPINANLELELQCRHQRERLALKLLFLSILVSDSRDPTLKFTGKQV